MTKSSQTLTAIFPSIIIIASSMLAFSDIFSSGKAIFSLSLVLLFPVLFLVQGILCSKNNTNIIAALGFSTLLFAAIVTIFLNSTAYGYIPLYLLSGFIGYGISAYSKRFFN